MRMKTSNRSSVGRRRWRMSSSMVEQKNKYVVEEREMIPLLIPYKMGKFNLSHRYYYVAAGKRSFLDSPTPQFFTYFCHYGFLLCFMYVR